jgi:tripartite ATP-independent transporter DctP family solute receptor
MPVPLAPTQVIQEEMTAMKKCARAWLIPAAIAIVMLSCHSASAQVVLKLGHDNPATAPYQSGALKLAELVNKKTGGSLQIKVYPAAQLGDQRELGELTKAGSLDICFLTAGVAANFVPSMNIFSLPFLLNDGDQGRALYEGPIGKQLLKDAEPAGLVGLGFHILSFRSPMGVKKPLSSINDFRGAKIRLMQVPSHLDTYRALGANPVGIPYSEVYMAAATGALDGAEGAPVNVMVTKWDEVMKYYSLLPVFFNASVMYVSAKTWERLSPAHRAALIESAPEANEIINMEYTRRDAEAIKAMEARGVVIDKGPFDLKGFRQVVKPVYDKYVPQLPPSAQQIVKGLQAQWK